MGFIHTSGQPTSACSHAAYALPDKSIETEGFLAQLLADSIGSAGLHPFGATGTGPDPPLASGVSTSAKQSARINTRSRIGLRMNNLRMLPPATAPRTTS